MKGHFYRGFILLVIMIVMPSLCWTCSGKVVHVADLDTATVERDSKRVKAFILSASEHKIYSDPRPYVLEKLKSSDIVFLGMTHKRPALLDFVRDLVPHLHEVGVTHLGLEIPSDQQRSIDRFLDTGESLDQIALHTQIECVEYRNLLRAIRQLDKTTRPAVIALDLPTTSLFSSKMSRDEKMARSIEGLFAKRGAKVFVVVGNLHVLKRIEWEDRIVNPHGFIPSYLSKLSPQLKLFSIGQCIDESPSECDFTKTFGHLEGAVAVNCDERFADWKIGIVSFVAAKPTPVCDMFDGVIIY
jgi:hypothetical protein